MSAFKVGDIVRFNGNRNRRTDYLADLESDWSDHMLTEAEYSMRVRILEGYPSIVMEIDDEDGAFCGLRPVDVDDPNVDPYIIETQDLKEHRV